MKGESYCPSHVCPCISMGVGFGTQHVNCVLSYPDRVHLFATFDIFVFINCKEKNNDGSARRGTCGFSSGRGKVFPLVLPELIHESQVWVGILSLLPASAACKAALTCRYLHGVLFSDELLWKCYCAQRSIFERDRDYANPQATVASWQETFKRSLSRHNPPRTTWALIGPVDRYLSHQHLSTKSLLIYEVVKRI